ncbi:unnamed protein product [Calicophoron daubneyi]|uniref:Endoplasmic reticulum resident protein 29 C-terminal domain-containing protein n=1 Tax=Calicophoron daubneyi TaxID=300641 RepID=A0AAV2TPI3_CALDB
MPAGIRSTSSNLGLRALFVFILVNGWPGGYFQLTQYSSQCTLPYLKQHLNDSPFSFVAIFDSLFPGDKFSEYQEFARYLLDSKDVRAFHLIHKKNLPPDENIFEFYNLSFVELPFYLMFRKFDPTPVVYRGSWKAEDILRWLSSVTGLRLPLPGCIASMDTLAHLSRTATRKEFEEKLLPDFKHIGSSRLYASSQSAQFYVSVATKLLDEGPEYLKRETMRLKRLVDSEVSDVQKTKFRRRLNILTQFMNPDDDHYRKKTEL